MRGVSRWSLVVGKIVCSELWKRTGLGCQRLTTAFRFSRKLTYLNKIKHFVHAYGEWIKHALAPLGPWGMLAFAAVGGSVLGLALAGGFVGDGLQRPFSVVRDVLF